MTEPSEAARAFEPEEPGTEQFGIGQFGTEHAGADSGGTEPFDSAPFDSAPFAADPIETDPYILEPDTLPTPFTALEIRDASPEGTVIVVRTTRPGGPPTYRRRTFLITDAAGTRLEVVAVDEAGDPIEGPRVQNPSWVDLQSHAVMSADSTVRERETITTALGEHECWRYTRRARAGATQIYWFALNLPGMPIAFETRTGEQVIERHEVLSWVTGAE